MALYPVVLLFRKIFKMEGMNHADWMEIRESLDKNGFARVSQVLSSGECAEIKDFYKEEKLFRSTINMQRYRFGQGEYRYFGYPLPQRIQWLRENFYKPLVPIANHWMKQLDIDSCYPDDLSNFLLFCHEKNQRRPTPLILRYETGGYNSLHQDIYGEVYFPFQIVFMLTQTQIDFEGGELVFVEQLPRAQSHAHVVVPQQGDAVIFTTNFRPVKGSRGYYRAKMKHGVSPVVKGIRYTMGLIFHDAS